MKKDKTKFRLYSPPYVPQAPVKTFRECKIIKTGYGSNINISDIPEGATSIEIRASGGQDDYDVSVNFDFVKYEEVPNPKYEVEYRAYQKKLAKYKEEKREWNKQKKAYDAEQKEKSLSAKKAMFEKLKKELGQ